MSSLEERRYAYETEAIERQVLRELSGLEAMQRVRDGRLPLSAIGQTLSFTLAEVEPGRAVVASEPQRFVYNLFGGAHGGYIATLLDSAMGCAVCTLMPRGRAYTTIDLTINYVRPVLTETGAVRAEGRVLHVGRRTATAEGRLTAVADGKLLAHGLTTCLVFEL